MSLRKYDIIVADLGKAIGSEQSGKRPCVVIQTNVANKYSNIFVVCPLSRSGRQYETMVKVEPSRMNGLDFKCSIDILQLRAVDTQRISKVIGVLDDHYKEQLKRSIIMSFDLNDLF